MKPNKITQEEEVLQVLKEQGNIEPMQALNDLGIYRLSACICRLRKQGYQISTKRITKQGRFGMVCFAEYRLENKGVSNG